uniref:Mitochondrial nucleoid factor 1 n=1 Tax=Soboliphyme baturini TaxID=241478 RepID=A0A183IHL3_9BILA
LKKQQLCIRPCRDATSDSSQKAHVSHLYPGSNLLNHCPRLMTTGGSRPLFRMGAIHSDVVSQGDWPALAHYKLDIVTPFRPLRELDCGTQVVVCLAKEVSSSMCDFCLPKNVNLELHREGRILVDELMAALRYKRFIKLCEMWPTDTLKSKSGRDLGNRIREEVVARFSRGGTTKISDEKQCDQIYGNLKDLVFNKHRNDYPVEKTKGALGQDLETCRNLASDETYEALKAQSNSILVKIRSMFTRSSA